MKKEKLVDHLSIVLIILLMAIFSAAGVMAHGEIVREGNILSQSKPEPINTGYMWKDRDGNLYPIYKILNKKEYGNISYFEFQRKLVRNIVITYQKNK